MPLQSTGRSTSQGQISKVVPSIDRPVDRGWIQIAVLSG